MPMSNSEDRYTGLPTRAFLFTLDQIAQMLMVTERTLKNSYIHFAERSPGKRPPSRMLARNIAPDGDTPEWRVSEEEFKRWMRHKGYKIYETGRIR